MWWKRKQDLFGAVHFPGTLAPTLESLEGLGECEVRPTAPPEDASWAATLLHPRWGRADIHATRTAIPLPDAVIEHAVQLTDDERKRARRAGATILLSVPAHDGDVLRDRKRLLHFFSAIMGRDGIVAADVLAQHLWTRARLDDELAHPAPLDIDQIHIVHFVGRGPGEVDWAHSHGLATAGFRDFDVLRPHPELASRQRDLLRALALAVVEGEERPTLATGSTPIELVPVEQFTREAAAADRALRDDEDHSEGRVVACDPPANGGLARLFRGARPRPARLLTNGIDERRQLVQFSRSATELMAIRARETIEIFGRLADEFAFLQPLPLVKLGYRVDGATSDQDREHLWFEVHRILGDRLDATLLNRPFRIARMDVGDRDLHPIELLTDWNLQTPVGAITPGGLSLGRAIRERRDELESIARQASRE
jgi:hypothetical protein